MQNHSSKLNRPSKLDPTSRASRVSLSRANRLWLVALATLLLGGCAGPIARPSSIMQKGMDDLPLG